MTQGGRHAAELLQRYGLEPRKALGQNFVVDPNTIDKIVRLSGTESGDRVIEVGPGLGALTQGLLDAGALVTAVEIDDDLANLLAEELAHPSLTIVASDAMALNWDEVADPAHEWTMVANLPYNVGTPLVLDVLDTVPQITSMTVMVQREVAERFAASAGSRDYGIPSVKVAYWARAEVVGRVSPAVFLPQPNVESGLVRITRLPEPAVQADHGLVFELVRTGFGQRRKMLRKSLGSLVSAEAFVAAGIRPEARPAELSITEWGALADAVATERTVS